MDLRGRRVFVLGDSLSSRTNAQTYDASAIKLTGSPGDFLATRLRGAGAAAVRVNAKSGRSAISLFSKENGNAILTEVAAFKPDLIIVFLGTNDIGYPANSDGTAFARIRNAFPYVNFVVLGPPQFVGVRANELNTGAEAVYNTLRSVFGRGASGAYIAIDTRPLTPTTGRAGDGIHFASSGAKAFAEQLLLAIQARPQPFGWPLPAALPSGNGALPRATNAWRWSVAGSMIGLTMIGVGAVYYRKKRRLAGLGRALGNTDKIKPLTTSQAAGLGRKLARGLTTSQVDKIDLRDELQRDPSLLPHAEAFVRAFWDERIEVETPEGAVRLDGAAVRLAAASEDKDDDGRMAHRPNDEGPPAHDLLEGGLAPKDIYEHPEWYTAYNTGAIFYQTLEQLRRARARAHRLPTVFVYRAMPKVSAGGFRTGDWVTLSEEYAKNEAETEGVPVYVARVPAKDVRWAGDDLMEFGYWGPPVKGKISWQRRLPRKPKEPPATRVIGVGPFAREVTAEEYALLTKKPKAT